MIPYVLHVAVLISVCLIFYKVLLQRETFYKLNRLVLVFCLALSFTLPLIPIPQQWALRNSPVRQSVAPSKEDELIIVNENQVITLPKQEAIKTAPAPNLQSEPQLKPGNHLASVKTPAPETSTPLWQTAVKWLFYLYWIGVAAFGLNLLLQIVVLLYQAYTKPVIRDGRFRIIELSGDKAPCSFGNNIFINPEKYDWDTYSQILLHEKIHIQQGHSVDILIAELVLVLQWFNPFAWYYRTELEKNLEFLTDDAVLGHKDIERESYQMSLLKVSAPHLSLGITTNYNQSLLKKRIVMMNAKKSNLHIMWKYFFLVPLIGILACALNNPVAYSQASAKTKAKANSIRHHQIDRTEGVWFATIKGEKINIEFRGNEDDEHNWSNSNTFPISDFPNLPRSGKGDFTLKREAGSVTFNGKFEGNEGYGHYKFTADKSFVEYLKQQGVTEMDGDDDDSFAFFTMNVNKEYIAMVKRNGFKELSKNNIISMAALKVDEPYIKMWRANGFSDITPNELVSGKAMHVDAAYVDEIRKAGYKDITFNQLISFKAQHITGAYIASLKKAKLKDGKGEEDSMPSANEISSYKAMNIDSSFVHSFAAIGYKNISYNQLTTLKALHITPEYVKSFREIGYNDLTVNQLSSFKSLGITPEFIKGYKAMGFKDLTPNNLESLKALNITPEYAKTFEAIGYKDLSVNQLSTMRSLNITPEFIKSYEPFGFKDLTVNKLSTLKSLNITPDFIRGFQALGFKDLSVNNLSSLKALGITGDFVKSFENAGLKNLTVNQLSSLKSMNVTAESVKGFKNLGFEDISVNELTSCKALGVTPEYVKEMQDKGFKSNDLEKYVRLKTAFN